MVQNLVRRLGEVALLAAGLLLVVGVAPTSARADDVRSSGEGDGVLSGNSVAIDVDAPVTLCGLINGFVVGGLAAGAVHCGGAGPVAPPSPTRSSASGDGVLSGNSAAIDVDVPISVECLLNGVGIVGVAVGACVAPAPAAGPPHVSAAAPSAASGSAGVRSHLPAPGPAGVWSHLPAVDEVQQATPQVPLDAHDVDDASPDVEQASSTSATRTPGTSPPSPPGLAATGADIGLEVLLGAGLVAGGGLCLRASRRRLARLGSLGGC